MKMLKAFRKDKQVIKRTDLSFSLGNLKGAQNAVCEIPFAYSLHGLNPFQLSTVQLITPGFCYGVLWLLLS